MNGRLPSLRPRRLIAALKRGDFVERRQTGSHLFLAHPERPGRPVPVPVREACALFVTSFERPAPLRGCADAIRTGLVVVRRRVMDKVKAFFEGAWIVPVLIVGAILFDLALELVLRITD